jgi:DNA polymerase-3 subunit gamma/tau
VTLQQVRDAWPEVLEHVEKGKRSAWMVVFTSQARALRDDVLTIAFPNETDVATFKEPQGAGEGVSEYLRRAILAVLGIRVKFIAKVEESATMVAPPADNAPAAVPVVDSVVDSSGWAVTAIPTSDDPGPKPAKRQPKSAEEPAKAPTSESQRYGESVVRELLGASFIEEQPVTPRVAPVQRAD